MLKDEYKIFANYYVLLNGALIVDTLGTKIKQEIIEKDIIKSIINEIKEENVVISVESGFNTYLLTDGDNLPYPKKERVNSIDEIEEELSLISIYSPEKDILEIEEVKNKINKKYEDMSPEEKIKYLENKNQYLEAENEYLKKLRAAVQKKKNQQSKKK